MSRLHRSTLVRTITLILLVLLLNFILVAHVAAAPPSQAGDTPMRDAQPYAVGWATLSLINAGLAQGKNRSGLLWFLLSIFLGPIATFILVVFIPKEPYNSED